jgi:hypothetical protein
MMGKIIAAKAYANNEVAFPAWNLAGPIDDCCGFEITRICIDGGKEHVLAAWVPFGGQSNPASKPHTTSLWPVPKMTWRALTARRRRDRVCRRHALLLPASTGLGQGDSVSEPSHSSNARLCATDVEVAGGLDGQLARCWPQWDGIQSAHSA